MTRLLHISDLHFGPPFDVNVADAVLRLAERMPADVVVVSGDVTQRAKRQQFADARDWLAQFRDIPVFVVPGNHDVPLYRLRERLVDPLGLYREYLCHDLNPVMKLGGVTLIGLDSTSPRRNISGGRIHVDQLARCRQLMRRVPVDDVRIVVAHHQFAPVPLERRRRVITKANRAMQCFVDLGVDMILGGHMHHAYVANSLDHYVYDRSGDDGSGHGVVIVQCGTTTSTRGVGERGAPNSLNVIDLSAAIMRVEHFAHEPATGEFESTGHHSFTRSKRNRPAISATGPGTGAEPADGWSDNAANNPAAVR